jgi:D-amino peptidase
VVVNDSHWTMQNLDPRELHGEASYISGKHKPDYMMQGLDPSFSAVFFVSYHGSIGAEGAVLSHTYNPRAIWEARLGGEVVGESGINALVALAHGVPVALVTGDRQTAEEARQFMPQAETAVVKESVSRFGAHSLHPSAARRVIEEAARRAVSRLAEMSPPAIKVPARLELTLLTADMAELGSRLRGVERTGSRAVVIEDEDPLRLYRTFVTLVLLTREVAGE